jgi:hypothetical protein
LLLSCLNNFTSSIKQLASSLKSIPDQIVNLTTSQIQAIANEFTAISQTTVDDLTSSQGTNTPQVISEIFNSPGSTATNTPSIVTAVQDFITTNVPSTEKIEGQKFPTVSGSNSP